MAITSLAYVGVQSPEYKEWEDFAPAVLGMQLADPGPDGTQFLKMDDRHHRIAVHPGERNRLDYLGWEVATEDDFEQTVEQLRRAGVEPEPLTDQELESRRCRRVVHFLDPAGIRHEIAYAQLMQPDSFHPPRRLSGFVTAGQGLGHAVLMVPDTDSAISFYRSALGFKLSDVVDTFLQLSFLHCNPRHHSLALASIPAVRGLHHIMVQLDNLDDVGRAYDICRERQVPISMTLGRHTNDRMVSFYLRTPSGFDIEYGWGALDVDLNNWVVSSMDSASIWGHHVDGMQPPGCIEEAS